MRSENILLDLIHGKMLIPLQTKQQDCLPPTLKQLGFYPYRFKVTSKVMSDTGLIVLKLQHIFLREVKRSFQNPFLLGSTEQASRRDQSPLTLMSLAHFIPSSGNWTYSRLLQFLSRCSNTNYYVCTDTLRQNAKYDFLRSCLITQGCEARDYSEAMRKSKKEHELTEIHFIEITLY